MSVYIEPTETLENIFSRGCELHENGRFAEAKVLYLEAVKRRHDFWLVHYNLGLLHFEQELFETALEHYQDAAAFGGHHPDLFYNLALCQNRLGRFDQAVQSYRHVLKLDPEDLDCRYNLARCYQSAGNLSEAMAGYQELLERKPDHQASLNNLAYLCHQHGQQEAAIRHYTRLLELNPDHSAAEHMLAALRSETRETAPPAYVRQLFDSYSDHFEDSLLNKLNYVLPGRLDEFVTAASGRHRFEAMLDLGCGTGLGGQALAKRVTSIDGIDLSSQMLLKAREKGIYRQLIEGNLLDAEDYFSDRRYDLILAADVLAYVGNLAPVFQKIHRLAEADARFVVSVEHLPESTPGMQLRSNGRFAHSEGYLRETAETNGWSVQHGLTLLLRQEGSRWLEGAVYCLKKRGLAN